MIKYEDVQGKTDYITSCNIEDYMARVYCGIVGENRQCENCKLYFFNKPANLHYRCCNGYYRKIRIENEHSPKLLKEWVNLIATIEKTYIELGTSFKVDDNDIFKEQMKDVVSSDVNYEHLDESANSYKDIDMVMENQKELVDVICELTPIMNCKG